MSFKIISSEIQYLHEFDARKNIIRKQTWFEIIAITKFTFWEYRKRPTEACIYDTTKFNNSKV